MAVRVADLSYLSINDRITFGNLAVVVVLYANFYQCLIKESPPSQMTTYEQLRWLVGVVCNPRGIGKSWQIRNLPSFSRTQNFFRPSRKAFVCRRILQFLLFTVMFEAYFQIHLLLNPNGDDFTGDKMHFFSRLRDITAREIFIRLWLPFPTYLPMYLEFSSLHCLISVIAVALGDDPLQWPPLFGDIRDAYTLRRFWGYVSVTACGIIY